LRVSSFTITGFAVLRAVAEQGSFTAAAEVLGYTQSAVSRQVAAMESAAGAALFVRGPRGVQPTPAGSRLLARGAGVLDHVEAARAELAALDDAPVRLRVGAFSSAWGALVPRAITAFLAEQPGATFTLREGPSATQLRRVRSGSCDLAVFAARPGHELETSGLRVTALLEEPLLLAVGRRHRLAARRTVTLDELDGEPWISGSIDPGDPLLGVLAAGAARPPIAFVARDWTAKLGLVAAGLGIALVPGIAAGTARADLALLRLAPAPGTTRSIAAATSSERYVAPAAETFLGCLADASALVTSEVERRVSG
jgi:DNA-binding transcriptional LysR family regulator